MRSAILAVCLLLSLPVLAAKLVDAPPPPPIPDGEVERDGTPKAKALPPAASRGQQLYENHCMGCHESVDRIRTRPQVKTLSALRETVARWAANAQLPWGKEEIEEVTRYLGTRFYGFEHQSRLE